MPSSGFSLQPASTPCPSPPRVQIPKSRNSCPHPTHSNCAKLPRGVPASAFKTGQAEQEGHLGRLRRAQARRSGAQAGIVGGGGGDKQTPRSQGHSRLCTQFNNL